MFFSNSLCKNKNKKACGCTRKWQVNPHPPFEFFIKEKDNAIVDWGVDIEVDNFLTFKYVLVDVVKEDNGILA